MDMVILEGQDAQSFVDHMRKVTDAFDSEMVGSIPFGYFRIAVDVDGVKVKYREGIWSPGYGKKG